MLVEQLVLISRVWLGKSNKCAGRGDSFFLLPRVRKIQRVFPGLYAHRTHSDKSYPPAFFQLVSLFLCVATLVLRQKLVSVSRVRGLIPPEGERGGGSYFFWLLRIRICSGISVADGSRPVKDTRGTRNQPVPLLVGNIAVNLL